MSVENSSGGGEIELTRAERAARDSVPESVESVVADATEADEAVVVEPTVAPVLVAPGITTSTVTVVAGAASDRSAESGDGITDEFHDASASTLIEARRDLA
ncbi:hypothetical protein [Halorussus halobius]|uniref:hypothetical protein n=1 Tax=Halorussus halobius TaxID=1710537 RepID=UPI0010929EC8|nr:hypothetical protein [Halorussus halobius]